MSLFGVNIKLNHHGYFAKPPSVAYLPAYINGKVDVIEDVDPDLVSFWDLEDYAKQYGYDPGCKVYFQADGHSLEKGFRLLCDDVSVRDMINLLKQVKNGTRAVTVDLVAGTCDCRVFDLTGIPCCHAVAAIHDSRQQPLDFVSEYYKRDRYLETYKYSLGALKGQDYWQVHSTDEMLPPDIPTKLRGRPKKLRRREEWEGGSRSRSSQQPQSSNFQRFNSRRIMHCSICGKSGHRKNKCPQKTNTQDGGQNGGQGSGEQTGQHTGGQAKKPVKPQRPKLLVRRKTQSGGQTGRQEGEQTGRQEGGVKVFARRKIHPTGDKYCLEGSASKSLEEELRGPLINDYKSTMDCVSENGNMRWWTTRWVQTPSGQDEQAPPDTAAVSLDDDQDPISD